MLPKTKLGRAMFQKLKVYAGDKHPHQAQQPQAASRWPSAGKSARKKRSKETVLSAQAIDYYATGKRKTAIARVHLRPGTGEIQLNDKTMDDYFGGHEALKMLAKQPFAITEMVEKFDVQRAACTAAVPRPRPARCATGSRKALCEFDLELRKRLKKAGFLTRDARIKERKKYGQKGARRRFQFSKR